MRQDRTAAATLLGRARTGLKTYAGQAAAPGDFMAGSRADAPTPTDPLLLLDMGAGADPSTASRTAAEVAAAYGVTTATIYGAMALISSIWPDVVLRPAEQIVREMARICQQQRTEATLDTLRGLHRRWTIKR